MILIVCHKLDTLLTLNYVYVYCLLYCSSTKLHTLMRAMSPAILRVGGSPADWSFFDKPLSVLQAAGLRPHVTVVTS